MPSLFDYLIDFDYPSLGECLSWRSDIIWLHTGANTIIAITFLGIPLALAVFANKRQLPHRDLLYLFMAFVFLCGLAHAAQVATVWAPVYSIHGWLLAITASASLITGLVLFAKLPEILANAPPNKENEQLIQELDSMRSRMNQMNSLYEAALGRENRISELKKEVNNELHNQGQQARYSIIEDRP